MTTYSHDELRELAPLFALGATTPEETAAIEAAMRTDRALAAEVQAFRGVTETMSAAQARSVTPSPELRGALLAAVAKEPVRGARETQVLAIRRLPSWVPIALAASLVVAVGLGADAWRQRGELARLRSSVAALDAKLADRDRTLNTVLDAEKDLYVVHLTSSAGETGPGIQFFWNAKQGKVVAHAFRLAPAPAGRDYQIWALVDGKPVSIKVFNSDPDGHALIEDFTVPTTAAGVSAVLVSLEPKGGSPQPTTTPFLAGTFPAA